VAGSVDSDDLINRQYCYQTHAHVFSLGYRLAPEYPLFPTIVNDSEDGLKWTYENAAKYGGDVSRGIFLSGTSSG
jgi:acetyl esterase/lipase